MKKVMFSFALVALLLISSVANAQCSSCGQQASAQPVIFDQPIVTEAATYAPPVAYAPAATTGCSSCGSAPVATYAAEPAVVSYAAPIETSYVAEPAGCSGCGQAVSYNAPVASTCCGETKPARGGLLRGGRSGVLGSPISSRLIRSGIFSAIRD